MICKFCENEIPDNSVVCPMCSNELQQQTSFAAQPDFVAPEPPKKKSKGVLIGVLSAVAAVTVGVVVCISLFGGNYLKRVERKSIKTMSYAVSKVYGQVLEKSEEQTGAAKSSIDLELGDSAITLLESVTNDTVDLDFLKNISIDMDINTKDSLSQMLLALKINDSTVIDADIITDSAQNDAYIALKSLSNNYLKQSLEQPSFTPSVVDKSTLPSEKAVRQLVSKYLNMVLDHLDEYEKSYGDLTAGGISKQVRILTVEIDTDLAKEILRDVLGTAKEDAELKALITGFAQTLSQDGDSAYDKFIEKIDSFLEETELLLSDEVLVLTSYVNSKKQVIGRKVEIDGKTLFDVYVLQQGKNFGINASLPQTKTVVSAMGVIKASGINAELIFNKNGQNVLSANLIDLKAGSGTIRITPLYNEIIDTSNNPFSNPQVEIVFDNRSEDEKMEISLLFNDEVFLGVGVFAKSAQTREITLPPSELVFDYSESEQWARTLDITELFDTIKNAGVPNEIVTSIMQLFFFSGLRV